jgi:hypothetical protein
MLHELTRRLRHRHAGRHRLHGRHGLAGGWGSAQGKRWRRWRWRPVGSQFGKSGHRASRQKHAGVGAISTLAISTLAISTLAISTLAISILAISTLAISNPAISNPAISNFASLVAPKVSWQVLVSAGRRPASYQASAAPHDHLVRAVHRAGRNPLRCQRYRRCRGR